MRGKSNPSLTQRYVYFSLTLIQMKIIAKTFEQGRDFWQVRFLRNTTKDEGNVTNVIASIRVNNLSRNLSKRYHLNTNVHVMIFTVLVFHYYTIVLR